MHCLSCIILFFCTRLALTVSRIFIVLYCLLTLAFIFTPFLFLCHSYCCACYHILSLALLLVFLLLLCPLSSISFPSVLSLRLFFVFSFALFYLSLACPHCFVSNFLFVFNLRFHFQCFFRYYPTCPFALPSTSPGPILLFCNYIFPTLPFHPTQSFHLSCNFSLFLTFYCLRLSLLLSLPLIVFFSCFCHVFHLLLLSYLFLL